MTAAWWDWRSIGCAVLLTSCGMTPLTNKLDIGEAAFVIGVGEGADSMTDLYAAPAAGGNFVRLSFNRARESGPHLAPDGATVAFLRRAPDNKTWSLVLLNLLTSGERSVSLPAEATEPEGLGWTTDGARVVVRSGGYFITRVPPAGLRLERVDTAALAQADSITRERLGPRGEGVVESCGPELCVRVGDSVTPFGRGVRGAVRWGTDSVGYFDGGSFEVRPLGRGIARRPAWKSLPSGLRDLTYSPAVQVTTASGVSGRR